MNAVYLNHAGTAWPKPSCVAEAISDALHSDPSDWSWMFHDAHAAVAGFFGIEDESRLLLTQGCTAALALAVSDYPFTAGDRILTSGYEHHALHRPMMKQAERGVDLEIVPPCLDGPIDLERVRASLRTGKVKMVAVTAASNVTGDVLPLTELAALTREFGAVFLVDGAQVAGWLPLNLPESGIDIFAFGSHKGMNGVWGIGGLYIASDVVMAPIQATCEVPTSGLATPCSPMPGYCDGGAVNRVALAGLHAAVQWLRGLPDRLEEARQRAQILRQTLSEMRGVTLYGRPEPAARMPTVAFNVQGQLSSSVGVQLASQGVVAAAGLHCAPLAHEVLGTAPDGVVRLSVGPMSTGEEIETACRVLEQL